MDGVQDVVQIHGAALPLKLLRVAAQEALHGGAAAARPDVPRRARAPVAARQAPPSVPAIPGWQQPRAQLPLVLDLLLWRAWRVTLLTAALRPGR